MRILANPLPNAKIAYELAMVVTGSLASPIKSNRSGCRESPHATQSQNIGRDEMDREDCIDISRDWRWKS